MPIDTDSERWRGQPSQESTKHDILEFLESNPEKAFGPEEVSVEVLGVGFDPDIPEEDLELVELIGQALGATQVATADEAFIRTHLSSLVYEGKVEVRPVTFEEEEDEWEVPHYSARSD